MTNIKMKSDLENRTGAPASLRSRRRFMRTAAITGGTGLLAAEPLPIMAQENAKKASLLVLPAATKDVTPFKVHVPQAALDDLKRRLASTRWAHRGTGGDWAE